VKVLDWEQLTESELLVSYGKKLTSLSMDIKLPCFHPERLVR
jgi:hypothetical protein